jgi:hypothetical protein
MADDVIDQDVPAQAAPPPEAPWRPFFHVGGPQARVGPEPPAPAAEPEFNREEPYAQFRADPQDDGIGLLERQRLNRQDAYYRGTLFGSARLASLAHLYAKPDEPETPAPRKRVNDALREEYRGIVADLAAYDQMKPFGTTAEAATAFAGQLAGSMSSPESFLGWEARGATFLARTARAALQQGTIQAAVNPAVQALSIKGGGQQEFEPLGPVAAFGTGAVIGGGVHAGGEALSNVIGQAMLRKQARELAREDAAFLGIVPHEPEPSEAPAGAASPTFEPTEAAPAPAEGKVAAAPNELAGTAWASYRTGDTLREQIATWRTAAESAPPVEATNLTKIADDAEQFLDAGGPGLDHDAHAAWREQATAPVAEPAAKPVADEGLPKASAEAAAPEAAESFGPPSADDWKKVGGQLGSNPGGVYEDPSGTRWYVKTPSTEDHAKNELLANLLYQLAGAKVPEMQPVKIGGKLAVASPMLPEHLAKFGNLAPGSFSEAGAIRSARAHFATDAWLANHDVIGLDRDNIFVSPQELGVYRIDQGGALRFRAKGEPKADFGPKVKEFETMRDPAVAPQAAAVFKGMTDAQLTKSIEHVLEIPETTIRTAVGLYAPGSLDETTKLADLLVARQQHLRQIYDKLIEKPPSAPTSKTAKAPKTPPEAKPAGKKGPQLDEATIAKAKALGFDTNRVWYHATKKNFEAFDLKKAGTNFKTTKAEKAIFLSNNPDAAVAFVGGQDANDAKIIPLFSRAKDIDVVEGPQSYTPGKFASLLSKAREAGKDAVHFKEVYDMGPKADQFAVLKPEMLRSVWAEFNPKKMTSKKLAAIHGQDDFDTAYRAMLQEAIEHEPADHGEATNPEHLLAIAQRKSGSLLAMEQKRQGTGIPQSPTAPGLPTTVPTPSAQQGVAVRSLQQQVLDLAKALDIPIREGRVQLAKALGTFNLQTGVVRVREVPDLEVVAHEAGHAIEAKAGPELTNLTVAHAGELGPLDYEYPIQARPNEGFAEYVRRMIGNPAHAQQVAPAFTIAFRDFMSKNHPEMLAALDRASAAYRAYLGAPSVDAVGAVRRSHAENLTGWQAVRQQIADEGFPAVIKAAFQRAYTAVLDDKAPIARTVRDLGRIIRDETGAPVQLKASDNPDVLFRLLGRARQAAVADMQYGVRPYQSITPEGPSLEEAVTKAVGAASAWGKWEPEKKAAFGDYLIARRAEYLWRKFKDGKLPNPPAAFSHADARVAMADLERANPNFAEASDLVHRYTRELLRKQFEGGLIDADLYRKLLAEEFYVPFFRDMSDKPLAEGGNPAGRGTNPEGPGAYSTVKGMKGSSRDIMDPIESLMMQTFLVNRTLRHNDVIRSFVQLAKRAGTEGGRYVEPVPAKEAVKYTVNVSEILERKARALGIDPDDARLLAASVGDQFGEDPIMGEFFRMENAKKRGEPIVFYKEGGNLRAARFMAGKEGHALYEALTAAPDTVADLWVDLIRAAAVVKRSGIVANPTFALSNYIRDQVAVSLLRSDYIPFVSGARGIAAEFMQGESAKLYSYAGGVAGGASTGPVDKAVDREIDALAKKGYAVNRLTSMKGLLELSSFTEAGTRNSVFAKVFEAKKKQGLSDYEALIEAAFQAQDILDFSRHGSHTMKVAQLLPFLNAHVQGLDKFWRTVVDPIVAKLKNDQVFDRESAEFKNALGAALKVGGLGAALGAVYAAINWEKEAYRDVSPYFKGTHLVVPYGDKLFVVPKPFELGLGFTAGEYAYAKWAKDDPRAAMQFLNAAWQSLSPPNAITDIPVLSTTMQLLTGKSLFTGRDIVPGEYQRLAPTEQYNERTSGLAKRLGDMLGLSPMLVDFAVGDQFGTWGRDVMALSAGIDRDSPALNMEDQIFLRRFIKDPSRTSDITTRFWNEMGQTTGKYNQDASTYDFQVKNFGDDKAREFLDKLPASERTFVTLRSAANEDGKPAFNADEKRLHPLTRAYDAVSLLNGLRRELTSNAFRDWETLTNLKLPDTKRRDLIDNIRELAQMEMRNALVIVGEPGYVGRPVLDVSDTMTKIRALSPAVANEIETRYATNRIYTTKSVQQAWPILRDEVVRHGSEADVRDLALDAKAEGYEFGGERVRKPAKRRISIQPLAAPQ